jgi:hypothetical protein
MKRSSWRLLLVVGALVLGALVGAYVAGTGVSICVDRVDGDSFCATEVRPSAPGAVIGAVLAGGTVHLTMRRWSRHQ